MPFEITASGPDIDDGQWPAVLEKVEEGTGQYGAFRNWFWLVEHQKNGEAKVDSLKCYTSANTGTGTISYKLLTGLIGREPKIGERFEDPTGTRVLVTIERNKKGFPTVTATAPYTEPQQVLPGVPR